MIPYNQLSEIMDSGDLLQIITDHFNGGIGKLKTVADGYIWLEPLNMKDVSPEYSSITHEVILPLKEIKCIIKINPKDIIENE